MEKLGDVIVRVLQNSWNARAATIKAARQEEKTPRSAETLKPDTRRAQDALLAGDVGRRLHKFGE